MYVVCEMAREMTAIGTVPSEVPRLDNGAGSKNAQCAHLRQLRYPL